MSDKVFLVSYKKNIDGVKKWNEIVHVTEKNFKLKGFKVQKIKGYNLSEHKEIKRNHIVYKNVLDKTLKKAEKYFNENKNANGCYIAEDDAFINLTLTELKKRVKKSGFSLSDKNGPILRIGYQKILKDNRFPRGYFCVGAQLIWIPRNVLKKFKDHMLISKPKHFNGFLTTNIELKIELIPQTEKTRIVDEIQHESLTLGTIRRGRVLSSRTKKKLKLNNKKTRFLNKIN